MGQSQRADSCHTERQRAERGEERVRREREKDQGQDQGQGAGRRDGAETGWTGWRTPTCSCKQKQRFKRLYLDGEKMFVILTRVEI